MLRVLAGGSAEAVDAYRAPAFDLTFHPLRPGFAHEAVTLALDARRAEAVERGAAAEGLPTPLWTGLVIESERALQAVARDAGINATTLGNSLNGAAARTTAGLAVQRSRRLGRYALALQRCGPRNAHPPCQRLTIAVPQHTLTAWELAAGLERTTVEPWATAHLETLPEGRHHWESAAAQAGQTLGEWIALQAARRSSN
jgi:hypothetical protein